MHRSASAADPSFSQTSIVHSFCPGNQDCHTWPSACLHWRKRPKRLGAIYRRARLLPQPLSDTRFWTQVSAASLGLFLSASIFSRAATVIVWRNATTFSRAASRMSCSSLSELQNSLPSPARRDARLQTTNMSRDKCRSSAAVSIMASSAKQRKKRLRLRSNLRGTWCQSDHPAPDRVLLVVVLECRTVAIKHDGQACKQSVAANQAQPTDRPKDQT